MKLKTIMDRETLEFGAFLLGCAQVRYIYDEGPKPGAKHHRQLRQLMRQPFQPAAAPLRREYQQGMEVQHYRLMG